MKATLGFNLPEDEEQFNIFIHAESFQRALHEIMEFLRKKTKYSNLTEKERTIYNEIQDKLYDILKDLNIDVLF
jgi:hypothetical protein